VKSAKSAVGTAALLVTAGLVLSGCQGGGAQSSELPSGNATMIVPAGPGGGSDVAGRAVAAGLEEAADLSISVENQEGGSGALGFSNFLQRKGDPNYLISAETALIHIPATQDVEFSYEDFTPIFKIGEDSTLILVREDSELQTCSDFVDKAKSGGVKVGFAGGLDEITFNLFEDAAGVKFDYVPFGAGSESTTALMGGQVEVVSANPSEAMGQIESGDVRPLCAAAEERYTYDQISDVPTAKEQGIDVAFAQYRGILAPGEISEEARQFWIDAAQQYVESDAYDEYIESAMLQPVTAFGDDFTSYLDEYNDTVISTVD
jgi:putative tricarboxylic transport membrane protein